MKFKRIMVLVILLMSLVLVGVSCQGITNQNQNQNTNTQAALQETTLVIDDGTGNPQSFVLEVTETTTAYDLLKQATEQAGLTLETKEYDFGISIEAIGDRKGGDDNKYWLYYVNDQPPLVAADKKIIQAGDKVEFKFEKSQF